MASLLTRSSARMGSLKPELAILKTPEIPLNLPEDWLQDDATDMSCARGESQPAATETENLAL